VQVITFVSNRRQDHTAVLRPQRHHHKPSFLLGVLEKDIGDHAELFFGESQESTNCPHPSCTLSERALLPIVSVLQVLCTEYSLSVVCAAG
jgi:hypothetical protein